MLGNTYNLYLKKMENQSGNWLRIPPTPKNLQQATLMMWSLLYSILEKNPVPFLKTFLLTNKDFVYIFNYFMVKDASKNSTLLEKLLDTIMKERQPPHFVDAKVTTLLNAAVDVGVVSGTQADALYGFYVEPHI